MRFKNSMKLSFANFSLFWKIALYKIIIIGISVLLFLPVGKILIDVFNSVNLFSEIFKFCSETVFSNISHAFNGLYNLIVLFFDGISVLVNSHLMVFIYSCVILLIVMPFLSKLSDIPASESLYGYMTSLTRHSFTISYVRNLGKSCFYSIIKTAFELPIVSVIAVGFYFTLKLIAIGGVYLILVPILVFTYLVITISLYQSLISTWVPSIVTYNQNALKSFKKGICSSTNDFAKILSNYIVLIVLALAIVLLFGGFSLIIILPLTRYMCYVFNMVFFFTNNGMRYYVDLETIITPKKLEETEQINKVKDIL